MVLGVERVSPAGIVASETDGQVLTSRDNRIDWETPDPTGLLYPGPWGDGSDGIAALDEEASFGLQEYQFSTVRLNPGATGGYLMQGQILRCQTLDLRGFINNGITGTITGAGGDAAGAVPGTAGAGGQVYDTAADVKSAILGGGQTGGVGGTPGNDGGDAELGAGSMIGGEDTANGGNADSGWGGDSGDGNFGGWAGVDVRPRPVTRFEERPHGYYAGAASPYGSPPICGGVGGGGGAGAAADGGVGAAGGGGGGGAGVVFIFARNIIVDATTPAGSIGAVGAAGGNGASGAAGNESGGGGGGGGGGGWVYVVYETITGTASNVIDVSGGDGGDGGDPNGAGTLGNGGYGGAAGRVTLVNLATGTVTDYVGADGDPNAGSAGGNGAILRVGLSE